MGHLHDINESYWDHFKFAIRIAIVLFITSLVLVFHAFFPNRQKDTASAVVANLHALFEARRTSDDTLERNTVDFDADNENETGVS